MTDFSLRAGRVQLYALVAALLVAAVIAAAITTGAFVLSFAVQRDLAQQALVPPGLAWIFPAIVDGAILGATIAVVAMSKLGGNVAGKRFFLGLAAAVVFISVYGNAFHAHKAATDVRERVAAGAQIGFAPLSPAGAALVAVIPPLLVLAFTHGIGVLVKAIGTAYTEHQATAASNDDSVALVDNATTPAPDTAPEPTSATPPVASDTAVARPIGNDTTAALVRFVETTDEIDDPAVRETALLRLTEPDLTWAEIAARTDVRAASTAWRRWERAEKVIAAAGLSVAASTPPEQVVATEQVVAPELVSS